MAIFARGETHSGDGLKVLTSSMFNEGAVVPAEDLFRSTILVELRLLPMSGN